MKLKRLTNESTSNPTVEKLIKQLVDMTSRGELDADTISDLNKQLLSARRKFFSSNRTSDDKKSAASKAKTTMILNKVHDAATDQTLKTLKTLKPLNLSSADEFALVINQYKDAALQKQYNKEYANIFQKLAAKAGVTDMDAIKKRIGFLNRN